MRTKLLIVATTALGTATIISLASDINTELYEQSMLIQNMFEEIQHLYFEIMPNQ